MPKPSNVEESRPQEALHALSNPQRLKILIWLIQPEKHFPPQRDGDLVKDGVCVGFITDKIGLSQPTVTLHMQVLAKAGLVTAKKIKNWVYYRPDDEAIGRFLRDIARALRRP